MSDRSLISPPSVSEVAISKGTANVSASDLKKLSPLMRFYGKNPHPFTACVNDNTKRWGLDLAKKRCAVLKDLIRGTTKWRNQEEEQAAREAYDEAVVRIGELAEILGSEFVAEVALEEAALTTKKRDKLPKTAFAIPETKSYPIHDAGHARNALARVSQHGTPAEKKKVRAAVKRRYKNIGMKEVELLEEVAAEIADCETLIRYLGPTLQEARVWVPSYKRLGSNVSGYWRELSSQIRAIKAGGALEIPGSVTIHRPRRNKGDGGGIRTNVSVNVQRPRFVVKGSPTGGRRGERSSFPAQHPQDAAKEALNLSARSTHPDSPGGVASHKNFASAIKPAGLGPSSPDPTQHHDYVDYSVLNKTIPASDVHVGDRVPGKGSVAKIQDHPDGRRTIHMQSGFPLVFANKTDVLKVTSPKSLKLDQIKRLEKEKKQNRRALDKLRVRGAIGRNAGATQSAIDRRLKRDLDLQRQLGDLAG